MVRIVAITLRATVPLQKPWIDLIDKLLLQIKCPFNQRPAFSGNNILRFPFGTAKKMCGNPGQKWRFLFHTKSSSMAGFSALFLCPIRTFFADPI